MDKDKYVKFSVSYLFSIKIDDKYLLVHSRRKNTYQPIGGCYKFFDSAVPLLLKLGCIPADKDPFDLRIFVPEASVPEFSDWLASGKDRENTFEREFFEEMFIENKYLNIEDFGFPEFNKVQDGYVNIKYDDFYKIKSAYPMDIVSVTLSDSQKEQIKKVVESGKTPFIFATESDIKKGEVLVNGKVVPIGSHTKKILQTSPKSLVLA